ncbi:unnamed protein product, partial [Brassica rapa]
TDSPHGPKSPKQSTGRASLLSPRTNVLISTDILCVLTHTHARPVCADGHPRTSATTSCVGWQTPTDVLCVLNRQPTWAKITQTVHGKGQRAESKDQHTHRQPQTSCVPHGPKSPELSTGRVSVLSPRTNVLICVLMDSHRHPVCADGHTRTSYVLCVLTDSHGRPVCAGGHPGTSYCPRGPKITQTVHGKGQRAESKDQRADMCTDGQPRTSYSPRGPKSPEQSTGRVSVLCTRTNVLICVLMDSHGRPVCADGHTHGQTRTPTDVLCVLTETHRRHVQPTWAKITRTVHGKGQHAESKDQRSDMCNDGQPRTSCSTGRASVLSPRTNVLICVLMDSHRRPVCADGLTRTSYSPHGPKITQTVHGKGQRAESMDQRAYMCTDGQPRTSCVF